MPPAPSPSTSSAPSPTAHLSRNLSSTTSTLESTHKSSRTQVCKSFSENAATRTSCMARIGPPQQDSREALRTRLLADYPTVAVDAVLKVYSPGGGLPTWRACRNWRQDAHGYVFADLQVHAMQRGVRSAFWLMGERAIT